MSGNMTVALEATTGAANSDEINLKSGHDLPATIHVYGLAGAEVAPLEIKRADDTWEAVGVGSDVEFSVDIRDYSVISPGVYRVAKPSTAGAAGVDWISPRSN